VDILVWVDDWQMQCCGEPFAVGSPVSWTLEDPDPDWLAAIVGDDLAARVDAAEEHHRGGPEQGPRTDGTVLSIRTVHCRYEAADPEHPQMMSPVPGSGVVTGTDTADGWEAERDGLAFVGYLVQLAVPANSS